MTKRRVRSQRRLRSRRRAALSYRSSPPGTRWLLVLPLLVVAFSLMLTKQQSIANTAQEPIPQKAFPSPAWVPTIAQASIPVPLTRQGEQITLNGRPVSAGWSQRQQRIGMTDAGLMQAIGVDLLSSDEVAQQPIEWFSDSSDRNQKPLVLSTWMTEQYRYLDITDLAERFGWQMQVSGSGLQISTPATKILSVRQGQQSWGDRVVVDMDQATPWQLDEERGEAIITINAPIDSSLARSFRGRSGNLVKGVRLESSGNRTRIRLALAEGVRPRVWSLNNPNRILIDVRSDNLAERNILWAPGLRWQQQYVEIGSGKFPVITLEIDPRQSGVQLKPIWGNPSMVGTLPLIKTAQRSQVAAAINGGYFNRNNQLPLGAIRRDGRWLSGPILNRGAIGWNARGEVTVGHLNLREIITTAAGNQLTLQSLNSGFVGAGVARYTPEWGTTYTPILNNEIVVTVQKNQVIRQQPMRLAGQMAVPIPSDGYLLVLRSDRTAANALSVGTVIQSSTTIAPDTFSTSSDVVGGGPLLLQDRQIVLNAEAEQFSKAFIQQAASRSVIATTETGKLILVTVHSRVRGAGPTLAEVARIMQQMGFVNALNLDGGSSTTLYLGGQLLDRAPSTAARVHNGLGVFIEPRL
ncbi:MAG TPA: phosphodiester glycosidase family protein [Trichocoleus sp.]